MLLSFLLHVLEAIHRYNCLIVLWGVPQMKQSIHLNRSPWYWGLSDWRLEDWQVSIIFQRKVSGSPSCDMQACEGLLSIFFLCVSFLTPMLFKKASEHLNDQNAAAWLSAPALSNLDGYVSASERGRHGWYTTQNCMHTRLHTQRFAHESGIALQTGERLSAYPAVEPGRKSGKMCSPVEMQSIIQLSGTTSYLFG